MSDIIEVAQEDVCVGDVITGWKLGVSTLGGWNESPFTNAWVVRDVSDKGIYLADGTEFHEFGTVKIKCQVRRAYAAVAAPAPRPVAVAKPSPSIPDWPLPCPRCQRAQSAVLLFSSMDCKHGWFSRGAK